MRAVWFALIGYLSGSLLFARITGGLLQKNVLEGSKDQNPGTANAFQQGGFLCGCLTLMGDLLKGALPVLFFMGGCPVEEMRESDFLIALVLAAPVLGHAFPIFFHFQGGKGIAVSFGCLLGLYPFIHGAIILALCFIFFSIFIKIYSHFYRTLATYLAALSAIFLLKFPGPIQFGFLLITGVVIVRMHMSKEVREKCKVGLLWRH